MASSIQLNSTNNSEMKIEYQGTSGVPKTVVVPDRNFTVAGTDEVIGVGQTWQDVKDSRALATTYTNTSGKPIQVNASCTSTSTATNIILVVDGAQRAFIGQNLSGVLGTVSAIIPNGATYSVTTVNGTLSYWSELR